MIGGALGGHIGSLFKPFFTDSGIKEAKKKKETEETKRAIGVLKNLPEYQAKKEIRENEIKLSDKLGFSGKLVIKGNEIIGPGLAEMLYMREHTGEKDTYIPESLPALDYYGTQRFLDCVVPGWREINDSKYSWTSAAKDIFMGTLVSGSPYSVPFFQRPIQGIEKSKGRGLSSIEKVALGILGMTAITFGGLVLYDIRRKKEFEDRLKPLIDGFVDQGDSAEEARATAIEFDNTHNPWAPYNTTSVNFAKGPWKENPEFASLLLNATKRAQPANDFYYGLNGKNPDFVKWLFNENPYFYGYLQDGNLDDYENTVLHQAADLGKLAPHLIRMPEVYTKEAGLADVSKYVDMVKGVKAKDVDAAQWILDTGLFMEDKKVSESEEKFVAESLSKTDLLRVFTSKFVMDGIEPSDLEELGLFDPKKSGGFGYLTDDLFKLPEAAENISNLDQEALKQIEAIVNASKSDYELRKGVCLIDEYGVPNQELFSFEIPKHNTQLQMLYWLAKKRLIPPEYYRVALAAALDYGSVITIGDDEVDAAVKNYVPQILDFVIETDNVVKEHGVDWQAKDYPLEADIGLVWQPDGLHFPKLKEFSDNPKEGWWENWYTIFNGHFKRPMNIEDWEYLSPTIKTLIELRSMVIKNFLAEDLPNEINMPYEETAEKYPYSYKTKIDKLPADFADWLAINWEHGMPPNEGNGPGYGWVEINDKIVGNEHVCNLDYLWDQLKKTDVIYGACGDHSYFISGGLKSINMSSICMEEPGHKLPGYYNPTQHIFKGELYEAEVRKNDKEIFQPYGYKYEYSRIPWDNGHIITRVDSRWRIAGLYDRNVYVLGVPLGYILRADIPIGDY